MAAEKLGLEVAVVGFRKFMSQMKGMDTSIDMTGKKWGGLGGAASLATGALSTLAKVGIAGVVAAAAAAVTAVAGLVTGLGALAVSSVKVATDFQDQMAILELAAANSETQFDELHNAALTVGADVELVGVSASGAADSMTGLYKAGLTTTEIFGDLDGYLAGTAELGGALRASIDLAAASELDMVQASDLAAIALATFGRELETEEERANFVAGAMNNLVQAADASVASVPDLAAALSNIGPVAAQFGFSLEDTNNALAMLSTRGIRGAEAGTALRSMLTNMMRPTNDVAGALDELNINLYDQEGVMRSLPDIVGQFSDAMYGTQEVTAVVGGRTAEQNHQLDLAERSYNQASDAIYKHNAGLKALSETSLARYQTQLAAAGAEMANLGGISGTAITTTRELTDEQRNQYIQTIAGTFGMKAMNVLLQEGTEGWNDMALATANAAGTSEYAAARAATYSGRMEALEGVLETLKIGIGEALLPALTDLVNWFSEMIEVHGPLLQSLFEGLGAWMSTNLPKAFEAVSTALVKAWTFMEPILINLWNWLQNDLPVAIAALQAWWEATWPVIQSTVEQVWDFLEPIFETIAEWLQDEGPGALDDLESAWDEVWSVITELTNKAVTWFKANMPLIIETIETLRDAGRDLMAFWRDHIAPGLDNVWNVIKNSVMTAMDVILNTITFVMQVITGDWAGAWETIKTTALLIWDNIKFAFGEYFQATLDMLGTSMEEIKAVWVANWELLKEILATVWDNIVIAVTEKIQLVYDTIVDKIEEIKDWIYDQIQAFKDLGGDIIKGMTQGVLAAIGGLIDAVRKAVADAMRSAWDEAEADSPSRIMYDLGLALVQGLINGIQAKAGDAQEMIRSLFDVGGVLGGLGAMAADRWRRPQKKLIADLERGIKLNEKLLEGEGLTQQQREIHMRYLAAAQTRLAVEKRKFLQMERETLALEKQRQDLEFLQEQAKLLELIREHGLDAGAIMGGIELGIDADVGAIVQAMTAAMQAIVEQAEVELGISSPSRVFSTIGMEMMAGLQAGIASMVPVIQTQMQMAVQPLALPGRSASPVTTNNEYNYHLTTSSVMRDGGLEMEWASMQMASK